MNTTNLLESNKAPRLAPKHVEKSNRFKQLIPLAIYLMVLGFALFTLYSIRVIEISKQDAFVESFENSISFAGAEGTEKSTGAFSVEKSQLNMVGVLYVPKIDLRIAIFEGGSETVLSEGSGLIMGDLVDGNHSIVTSHNGDSVKDLFANIPKLENGDNFYIQNTSGVINEYQVMDTREVTPDRELDKIYYPNQGDPMVVALRTCTPIGINSHRFLASGEFVGTIEKEDIPEGNFTLSLYEIMLISVSILAIIFIINWFRGVRKNGIN